MAGEGTKRHREYLWECDLFRSLRDEFDPLDREILERAFDAALAVIGDDTVKQILRSELIQIAHLNGLSDPETLRDLLLARLPQIRPAPGAGNGFATRVAA